MTQESYDVRVYNFDSINGKKILVAHATNLTKPGADAARDRYKSLGYSFIEIKNNNKKLLDFHYSFDYNNT